MLELEQPRDGRVRAGPGDHGPRLRLADRAWRDPASSLTPWPSELRLLGCEIVIERPITSIDEMPAAQGRALRHVAAGRLLAIAGEPAPAKVIDDASRVFARALASSSSTGRSTSRSRGMPKVVARAGTRPCGRIDGRDPAAESRGRIRVGIRERPFVIARAAELASTRAALRTGKETGWALLPRPERLDTWT